VEKTAGVIEHHSWVFALVDQFRYKIPHAFVTPLEHRCVVVVAKVLVLHHVLEVADDSRRLKIRAARWNQRLMHV
jgi:hypothetical protein